MKRGIKGSVTIEASVLVPLVLLMIGVLFQLLFYFHDKNIIASAAYETGVYSSGRQGVDEAQAQRHFQSRIEGKLLLFTSVQSEVAMEEDKVSVRCHAKRNGISLQREYLMSKTKPEKYIRSIKILQKGLEKSE